MGQFFYSRFPSGIIMTVVLRFFLVFFFFSWCYGEVIRFWTTEIQPDRLAKQQQIADQFKRKTGHLVKVVPVDEKDMGTRVTASFAAGDLPDVIYFTLQNVLPWAEDGILDVDASDELVEELGVKTFVPGVLLKANRKIAAVPVDGWTQMLLYRKDLFKAKGLKPPTTYQAIRTAINKLHQPPKMYGFVAPTKINEVFMSQVLEHIFLANGVSPVDRNGFKPLNLKKTKEVLRFYKALVQASPPGELYWKQARELYFAGKAAMIIWSPFILDELAGLRNSAPPAINDDPTSPELAEKSDVVTSFSGPSNPQGAAYADIRYFGITSDANAEIAQQFIRYSMSEAYTVTLSIAPEGKFPVRRGTANDPDRYIKSWSKLPVGVDRKAPLADFYPQRTIKKLVQGLEKGSRWGVKEDQFSLASKYNNSRLLNKLVREYIDGERTVMDTIKKINQEFSKIK